MRIGIITFHRAHNYGAVLQAYALNKTLTKMEYDSEVIDYSPGFITRQYSISIRHKIKKFKSLLSLVLMYPARLKRYKKFQSFIENEMQLSLKKYNDAYELWADPPVYDVYITGSDQVWNPEINGVMGEYFLDFAKNSEGLKISYAASFGSSSIDVKYNGKIANYLRNMDLISVREQDGVNIIRELIGIVPKRVIDPVFLLSRSEWENITITPSYAFKYILVYMLEYNEELIKIANQIAVQKKLKILSINNSMKVPKGFESNLRDVGPKEFLGLFYSAEYIITNSFHGTAFSIIFEKKFIVVPPTRLNSRIQNILEILALQNLQVSKVYSDSKDGFNNLDIDYSQSKELLKNEIGSSLNFLDNALTKSKACVGVDENTKK